MQKSKKTMALVLAFMLMMGAALTSNLNLTASAEELPDPFLHYDMSVTDDTTVNDVAGSHDGELVNPTQAGLTSGPTILFPGGTAGSESAPYIKIPAGTLSGKTNVTISALVQCNKERANEQVFMFGTDENKYILMSSAYNEWNPEQADMTAFSKFGATTGSWQSELILTDKRSTKKLMKGEWAVVTAVFDGTAGKLRYYIDGVLIGEGSINFQLSALLGREDIDGYIGKSFYPDPYFSGSMADFRIYDTVLTAEQIEQLNSLKDDLPDDTPEYKLALDKTTLRIDEKYLGVGLRLPLAGQHGSSISWTSDSDAVVVGTPEENASVLWAKVTRPAEGVVKATLTATLTLGELTDTKTVTITIDEGPLYEDPVYDGATDPMLVYNRTTKEWWMFYTQRRASVEDEPGVAWIHGTDIGIAVSSDGGHTWTYRGTAQGLYRPGLSGKDKDTYWAPEVIYNEGIYHMYLSYVEGVPSDWGSPRHMMHYTSTDLYNWTFEAELTNIYSDASNPRTIDSCVFKMPDGKFGMWYKDEWLGQQTSLATSTDLYNWTRVGEVIPGKPGHEGSNVFYWKNKYWLVVDPGDVAALSSDNAVDWTWNSRSPDDPTRDSFGHASGARHADILVQDDEAYMLTFRHPNGWQKSEVLLERLRLDSEGYLYYDPDEAFDYFLKAPTVTSMSLKTAPTKTSYQAGEPVDFSGLSLSVEFIDTMGDVLTPEDFEEYGISVNAAQGSPMPKEGIVLTLKNGESLSIPLTVTEVPVQSVTVNPTTLSIDEKATRQLKAVVEPANATDKTIEWTSSNKTIATVSATGLVTGVKAGKTIITATAANGKFASCTVTVNAATPPVVKVKQIVVSPALTLVKGKSGVMRAAVAPKNATNSAVTWKSDNTRVATVDQKGNVKGVGAGTTTITATAKDGSGVVGRATVTVHSYVTLRIGYQKAIQNGNRLSSIDTWGSKPFKISGRAMVPIRFVSERMGGKTTYTSDSAPIVVTYGSTTLEFRLGSKTMKVITSTNTKNITLDVAAQKKNGRTYIPLRAVGQALGFRVYYDAQTEIIVVNNPTMSTALINTRLSEGKAYIK